MQLMIGLILLVVSCLAYWHALPRNGEVRSYLRNDHVQAYYSVALIVGLVSGVLLTVLAIVSFFN